MSDARPRATDAFLIGGTGGCWSPPQSPDRNFNIVQRPFPVKRTLHTPQLSLRETAQVQA